MKAGIAFRLLLGTLFAVSYADFPELNGLSAQTNSPTGVLTLDGAIASLRPIILRGRVTASASAGHSFSDPASVDHEELSQSNVFYDKSNPCLVTWDETTSLHYDSDPSIGPEAGKTVVSGERHFLWLASIIPAEIKVADVKAWANDDEVTDSTVSQSADGTYTGFVLTTKHSTDVISIYPLKRFFPNPSSFKEVRKSERIFFATRTDADDAKKLWSARQILYQVE